MIFDLDVALTDKDNQGYRIAFNRDFRETGLDWE